MTLIEGETKVLTIVARDSAGVAIPNAPVVIRSGDTATVTTKGDSLVGVREGTVYVHVRFGTVVDSALVSVRAKGSGAASGPTGGSAAIDMGKATRPTILDSSRVYATQRDQQITQITKSVGLDAPSGRHLSGAVFAGMAAHSSNQSAAIVEDRTGVMYGGGGNLALFSWMHLDGEFKLGDLTATGTIGEPMKLTEADGNVTFFLSRGLAWVAATPCVARRPRSPIRLGRSRAAP